MIRKGSYDIKSAVVTALRKEEEKNEASRIPIAQTRRQELTAAGFVSRPGGSTPASSLRKVRDLADVESAQRTRGLSINTEKQRKKTSL